MNPPYSRAEIERARALKQQGLSTYTIALRLGRSQASLKIALNKADRGLLTFRHDRFAIERAQITEMVADGLSPAEIARQLGCKYQRVFMRLIRMGLDGEMRRNLRAERTSEKRRASS